MKPLGFSLEEMAALLKTADEHRARATDATSAALADYLRIASERRDRLVDQVAKADEFIEQLRGALRPAREG